MHGVTNERAMVESVASYLSVEDYVALAGEKHTVSNTADLTKTPKESDLHFTNCISEDAEVLEDIATKCELDELVSLLCLS